MIYWCAKFALGTFNLKLNERISFSTIKPEFVCPYLSTTSKLSSTNNSLDQKFLDAYFKPKILRLLYDKLIWLEVNGKITKLYSLML